MRITNVSRRCLVLAVVLAFSAFCHASDGDKNNVLAWVRFEKAKFVYASTPYLWLGHGDVTLSIDVAPRSGHVLELLWGAKGDVRSAVATINGREVKIRDGGYDGFRWIAVPLPPQHSVPAADGTGDRYAVTLKQAGRPQAFIAAVRLSGEDGAAVADVKKSAYKISFKAPAAAPNAATPPSGAFAEMRAIWDRQPPVPANPPAEGSQEAAFRRAEINSRQAAEAFFRSRRFIDGWLRHADEKTGLIPRNLDRNRDFWNAKDAVLRALGNMNEHYRDYGWEGGSNDGYADSIESALNLYNREAVPSVAEWMDHEIRYMFRRQRPDGVIEGWHGDGNSARTWLLYALWKTQGLTARPWRADLRFGAVRRGDELLIHLAADKPWEGRLVFDVPRHQVYLKLPIDYPRLNQFPEWFTARAGKRYTVRNLPADSHSIFTGRQLRDGLPVTLKPGAAVRLVVGETGS
ncbi:MAG: hypothetical protein HQ567_16980 [Candidatus Nealsonbacteria bacterium]|nr:hypothetical protein [Candidatus Nealsonbacteria bacterium]